MNMVDESLVELAATDEENIEWHNRTILLFVLADQSYALPILDVVQIVKMVALTPLPQAPHSVQGVINVRGQVVPVIDLRIRFGLPFQPYSINTPIILARYEDRLLAFIVDEVVEVRELSEGNISATADVLPQKLLDDDKKQSSLSLSQIARLDDKLIPIVSVEAILAAKEEIAWLQTIISQDAGPGTELTFAGSN